MIRELKIETNDDFEGCNHCKYCDDNEIQCRMRGCIHAIASDTVKECYKPKEKPVIVQIEDKYNLIDTRDKLYYIIEDLKKRRIACIKNKARDERIETLEKTMAIINDIVNLY